MARCEKSDRRGKGCIKEEGHGGRCKVRANPEELFKAGGEPAAVSRRGAGKGLAAELTGLAESVGAVEQAVGDLLADFNRATDAMKDRVATARSKAAATLAALVRSRRQVAKLLADTDAASAG